MPTNRGYSHIYIYTHTPHAQTNYSGSGSPTFSPEFLHLLEFGDKFGESLVGSQAPPSFWEVPGLPRKFPTLPRKFLGDFPGSSLTVGNLTAIPGFPGSFPDFPGSSPDFPGSFPDFPGGQPLSLGSLTPSLKTLTSLNKESRPFSLGDKSIWSFPSVSSLSDYSIWRSWRLF